jgi:hypothetical protein
MGKKQFLLILITVFLLLAGCSFKSDNEIEEVQSSVEWVDAIAWNGKKYYYDEEKTAEITENDIEKELGEITFTVTGSKEVDNPSYQLKNGEATFVGKGSIIYSIKGEEIDVYIFAQNKVYKVVE